MTTYFRGIALLLLWPLVAFAETNEHIGQPAWSTELYGGRYYDEERIGAYLATSMKLNQGTTAIGELMHEHYPDYRFSGVGGHLLWSTGKLGDLGIVASYAWERYKAGFSPAENYDTSLIGVEWEYEAAQISIAAQAGKYLKDYADKEPSFLSGDAYFTGQDSEWYLRTSGRVIGSASMGLIEAYRNLYVEDHLVTGYAGLSRDHLTSNTQDRIDSAYAGFYTEVLSTPQSSLTLWMELSKDNTDTLLTLEFNLTFDKGARKPYITAFGYSLDN